MTANERKCSHVPNCTTRARVIDRGIPNCALGDDYPCADVTAFLDTAPRARKKYRCCAD